MDYVTTGVPHNLTATPYINMYATRKKMAGCNDVERLEERSSFDQPSLKLLTLIHQF
jgi:hypothetical protein